VTIGEIAVEVGDVGVARVLNGLGDRHRKRRPIFWQVPSDRHPSIRAAERPTEIAVELELAEKREDVIPTPSDASSGFPTVVIAWEPTQSDHPHEAGAAPHYARLHKTRAAA
jgi:hypothetical protein